MKSIILYSSPRKTHHAHRPYNVGWVPIYIRHEVYDGDLLEALDKAKPDEGETVLNTIPHP